MTTTCPICGSSLRDCTDACPSCGYKFSGATHSFKPIGLTNSQIQSGSSPRTHESFLRVLRGPLVDTIFPIGSKVITIGRSPKCDICLSDMTVSREHARIVPVGNRFCIEDLHSFNGVWVNNISISKHTLISGDIVQLGAFSLVYQEV